MSISRGYSILLLIFITLGVYYPSIFSGANTIDDPQTLTAYFNANHFDLKALFLPASSGYYYRPLLGLTFYFDSFVWGMSESFLHLENILFHTLNVILVYLISGRLSARYSNHDNTVPLCAALLFAIHPINTESVNWISGRTDLIACIFLLLSLYFLLIGSKNNNVSATITASIMFLLSCFAKEVAVCALPGLLFLVLYFEQHGTLIERLHKRWLNLIFLSSSVLIYFLFRFMAFSRGDSGLQLASDSVKLPASNFYDSVRIILKVFGFYTKKLFFPWPLNFAIVKVSDFYVIVGVLLTIFLLYIFYNRSVISGLFLTSICVLSPALLVAFGKMTWTPLAERYLYIPAATFCIAITLLYYIHFIKNKAAIRTLLTFSVVLIFLFSTYTTVNRNITWQSNVALFKDALKHAPDFFLAQNALATALGQEGRHGEAKTLLLSMVAPEGNKRGEKLVDSNRARILAAEGDLEGAKELLSRNINDSGVLYAELAEQLIRIDISLLNSESDNIKRRNLRQEIVNLMLKLQEKSGDSLYYYRIGQFYLINKDNKNAKHFFHMAYSTSKDGAYYKEAAKKLSDKLR